MSRVRMAEYGVLYQDREALVWDDYLHHEKFGLTQLSVQVLHWFAGWRELDSVAELGSQAMAVAKRLVETGILVIEGSARHEEEERLRQEWGSWGPASRFLHFAAHSDADATFIGAIEDELRAAAQAHSEPPPPPWKTNVGASLTPFPDGYDGPPDPLTSGR